MMPPLRIILIWTLGILSVGNLVFDFLSARHRLWHQLAMKADVTFAVHSTPWTASLGVGQGEHGGHVGQSSTGSAFEGRKFAAQQQGKPGKASPDVEPERGRPTVQQEQHIKLSGQSSSRTTGGSTAQHLQHTEQSGETSNIGTGGLGAGAAAESSAVEGGPETADGGVKIGSEGQRPRYERLLKRSAQHATQGPGYLAICVIARDVNRDIREWAEFHLWSGAEKIYLHDHNSSTPMIREVEDLVVGGQIHYEYHAAKIPVRQGFSRSLQGCAWRSCILQAHGSYRWMAFIDADEFIVIQRPSLSLAKAMQPLPSSQLQDPAINPMYSIPSVLRDYEAYPALALAWLIFGPNNLQSRPQKRPAPVLTTFTRCGVSPHSHLKVIAQVEQIQALGGTPHDMVYKSNSAVTEAYLTVSGASFEHNSARRIALHHYLTKSREEYKHRVEHYRQGMSGYVNKTMLLLQWAEREEKGECLQGAALGKLIQMDLDAA